MFKWIKQWFISLFAKRRIRMLAISYTQGYFLAHEELRSGRPKAIPELRAYVHDTFVEGTRFERGVEDAIRLYLRERGLAERIKLVHSRND